jgi:hypothetical protein
MTRTIQSILLLTIALVAGSGPLLATDADHGQHEAHVHGKAKLLIALDDDTLEIAFVSPAMNIVGFEHHPRTETQDKAIKVAIETLKQPDLLFTLPSAAKCTPTTVEVESPLSEHDAQAHEEETHSDFTCHYHYQCGGISRLERIEIELFQHFPGTHTIEVQSISTKGQQKLDLNPEHTTLEL